MLPQIVRDLREVVKNSLSASSKEPTSMGIARLLTKKQTQKLLQADEELRDILKQPTNVNARLKGRSTLLMQCASKGNAECVKVLLDAGAIVNLRDNSDKTALMLAVMSGNAECVGVLIEAGAKVNLHDQRGETALIKSVHPEKSECFKLLLEAGAKVNVVNSVGNSPLMVAAVNRDTEQTKLLIQAGADVNSVNKEGFSPLMLTLWDTRMKKIQNQTSIPHAIEKVDDLKFDSVKLLVDAGADVNIASPTTNVMPLAFAVLSGEVNCVKILLQQGATVNQKYFEGLYRCLTLCYEIQVDQECLGLFFAAGGNVSRSLNGMDGFVFGEDPLRLSHLCRERVRRELLTQNPETNVFHLVGALPLPPLLKKYLHYYLTLDVE